MLSRNDPSTDFRCESFSRTLVERRLVDHVPGDHHLVMGGAIRRGQVAGVGADPRRN